MKEIRYSRLGETWLAALREIFIAGENVGDETREVLHLAVAFETGEFESDPLLARFGSSDIVREMRKVFFTDEPNQFGHSYRARMCGPAGRNDLGDIVELLRRHPESKRAVVSFAVPGDGTVPCINALQFFHRRDGLSATYFSRGQDIFRKFYADGICLYEMARKTAADLGISLVSVTGFISSAHVYIKDVSEIENLLAQANSFSTERNSSGGMP
jgi:thymidylate synthase